MEFILEDQTIPLCISILSGDTPQSGKSVTVSVVNVMTGATLLATVAIPETSFAGLYTYAWAHGRTVKTHCLATYLVGTTRYQEFFTIDDLAARIDMTDGRAV